MEENTLPKLRYADFEDAWQKSLLIEQVEIRRGLTYKPSDVRNNGVRVLRSSNIAEDTFVISDDDVFVDKGAVNIPRISNGDILVTAANGSTKLVGKHAIVKNLADDELAVHGGFMLAIKAEQNTFVNAWMSSKEYKKVLQFIQGGNGAIGNLSTSILKSMKMTIPASLEEQSAIGSLFRTLDDLLAAYKEKLTNYQTFKSSMLSKMFPKSGQKVPEIRLAGFEGRWKETKMRDYVTLLNGRAYKQEELLKSGKYRVLRVGNFNTNSEWYYSDLELENNKYANTGDLLYLWATNFGPQIWNEEKVIYHYHIWKLEFKDEIIDRDYLYIWLENDKKRIQQNTNGSTMVHITKNMMEDRKLLLPCYDEQHAVGSFFSNLDSLLTSYQDKIFQLETLKKKLLQDMFI